MQKQLMDKKGLILMHKYELGRMLGQGNFAKVYFAKNLASGENVAIKVIDKDMVKRAGLIDQIKREISVMRLVRHPNIVQLYEVMASKSKIYFVMEYVKGGELFNKVSKGRLKEDLARRYFQQLIGAVDFCHSRGVYHRDLKPENLLLDQNGNLKVSDFGLSTLKNQQGSLLHTTCGTPAYVAPEIINKKGYCGDKADIWSCGVILFVLLAGYLPFHDANLMVMYRRIIMGEFKFPPWFSSDIKKLLSRLLDPHPSTRLTIARLVENPWFKKGFKLAELHNPKEDGHAIPLDVHAAFASSDSEDSEHDSGEKKPDSMRPACLNAFDIISRSKGFDLSGLFEKDLALKSEPSTFTTQKSASAIVSKLEEIAGAEHFRVTKKDDGTMKLQGSKQGRKGQLAIDAEIFEVTPSFHVVEMKKAAGDTLEYETFCNQELKPSLKDIVWAWQGADQPKSPLLPLTPLSS